MEYEIDESESVSSAIIRFVSAVNDCDPSSLPPLTGVLDPDALNRLFSPQENGEPRTGGYVVFEYDQYRFTVESGEHITARPIEDQSGGISGGDIDSADEG